MAIRVALAQVSPVVGDLPGNAQQVLEACTEGARQGAQVVLTPELALTGSPLGDLAMRRSVVDASQRALRRLAQDLAERSLGDLAVVVGVLGEAERIDALVPPLPQNCAAVLHQGRVLGSYAKARLTKQGSLDERRLITKGRTDAVLEVGGARLLLAIGEDLVHEEGPLARAAEHGAGAVLALGSRPFEPGGLEERFVLLARCAEVAQAPVALANLVGATDDVVFDGGSCVVDPSGRLLAEGARFLPDLVVVDLPVEATSTEDPADSSGLPLQVFALPTLPGPATDIRPRPLPDRAEGAEEIWAALRLAVRDFTARTGRTRAVVGLSGGADSAVVAAVAVDALGAENVIGVISPSATTSEDAMEDAEALGRSLGIATRLVPIATEVEALGAALGLDDEAAASLHYRLRGVALMELAALEDALVLASVNRSELALGAATPHGDAAGDLAPLRDVPRTMVSELARWRNAQRPPGSLPPIPARVVSREPSSHTRRQVPGLPALPPYPVIDAILDLYLDQRASRVELLAAGFSEADVDAVLPRVDAAEALRRQAPPGPRLGSSPYGRDPRLPIASRWREVQNPEEDA